MMLATPWADGLLVTPAVVVAVSRWTVRLAETGWGDTSLSLPGGVWRDRLTDAAHTGRAPAAALFAGLPVALLERVDA